MSKISELSSTAIRQDLIIQLKAGDSRLINKKTKRPFIYRAVFSFMSIIDKAINQ